MKVQLKRGRRPKESSKPNKEEAADGSNTTAFSESDRENKVVSHKRKWKSVDEAITVVEEQMQKPVKRSSLRSNKKSDSFDVLLVRKFIFIVERRCC